MKKRQNRGFYLYFFNCFICSSVRINKNFSSLQWFPLEEVATGKLHLKLEWLSLLSTPERLDQVQSPGGA